MRATACRGSAGVCAILLALLLLSRVTNAVDIPDKDEIEKSLPNLENHSVLQPFFKVYAQIHQVEWNGTSPAALSSVLYHGADNISISSAPYWTSSTTGSWRVSFFNGISVFLGSYWNNSHIQAASISGFDSDQNQVFLVNMTSSVTSVIPKNMWQPTLSVVGGGLRTTVVNGYYVTYSMQVRSATFVFGHEVNWPFIAVVLGIAGIFLTLAALVSALDACSHPRLPGKACHRLGVFFGNTFFLFLGGFSTAVAFFVWGIVLCVLIVFFPCGVNIIRLSKYYFLPFGRSAYTSKSEAHHHDCGCLGATVWLLVAGLPLAFTHFVLGIVFCVLLITIPIGLKHIKLGLLALSPFGKTVIFEGEERFEQRPLVYGRVPNYV